MDGRSDLFSLGVVLYELLTKRKPFIGDNLTSISYKIVHEEYPPAETYDATIPGEFGPILARALAKDPAARFQSGKDFHAALAEFRTRHAEMEMLRDLGEMVAQAENLGPVSTVESKKTPLAEEAAPPRPGVSKGPAGLGGGATSLEDLARRGRSDLNPALVGPAPTNLDSSIPDWSLDTDALKSPAEREAAKKKELETPEPVSSPGTLVSDVQRGVKKAARVRRTEAKISTGEIKRPASAFRHPCHRPPSRRRRGACRRSRDRLRRESRPRRPRCAAFRRCSPRRPRRCRRARPRLRFLPFRGPCRPLRPSLPLPPRPRRRPAGPRAHRRSATSRRRFPSSAPRARAPARRALPAATSRARLARASPRDRSLPRGVEAEELTGRRFA